MSKINIKSTLKNSNETHIYNGKGIQTKNTITYNDHGIITKLTINKKVTIERKNDYIIKLGFNINEKEKGTYITREGKFETETETKELKITKNSIKIKYNLKINNVFIDTFEFNLKYTIDTE